MISGMGLFPKAGTMNDGERSRSLLGPGTFRDGGGVRLAPAARGTAPTISAKTKNQDDASLFIILISGMGLFPGIAPVNGGGRNRAELGAGSFGGRGAAGWPGPSGTCPGGAGPGFPGTPRLASATRVSATAVCARK